MVRKSNVSVPRWLVNTLIALMTSGIIGGVSVAFRANSWAATIEQRLETAARTAVMANSQSLTLAPRMAGIEQQVESLNANTIDNREQLREIDRKLDRLLERGSVAK